MAKIALRTHLNEYQLRVVFILLYSAFCLSIAVAPKLNELTRRRCMVIALSAAVLWGGLAFGFRVAWDGTPRFSPLGAFGKERPAVVSTKELRLFSGNAETFQVVFVLHDGAEVEIGEQREDWLEVLLPGGRKGWAKKEGLEVL